MKTIANCSPITQSLWSSGPHLRLVIILVVDNQPPMSRAGTVMGLSGFWPRRHVITLGNYH